MIFLKFLKSNFLIRVSYIAPLATLFCFHTNWAQEKLPIPSLKQHGRSTQLVVDGKPFLVLGGELGNSTASDLTYLSSAWNKLEQMNCNTVLAPVYWELIEPEKGHYDFSLVDGLLDSARKHKMKVVLLWFGVWKNSMSCYAPAWVKKDYRNYPRAYDQNGEPQEILTPFSKNNLEADIAVFRALMTHVKENDKNHHTVIMVQVENEIGMLPSARDYHPDATRAFNAAVPAALLNYIVKNQHTLFPTLFEAWKKAGSKMKGSWEEVFGKSLATDEMFMAWHFADFANQVTKAGKEIYPLPMFVNAALNRPNVKPGDYPSGGPLPHLIDIWKAAAPAIDFLSPDFYNPDFKYWNDLYTRGGNPLFIPEIRFEPSVAAKVFYALGHYHAMGFSPFSIESTKSATDEPLGKSYRLLSKLIPLLGNHQGLATLDGTLLDKRNAADTLTFSDYIVTAKHDYTLGWSPKARDDEWPQGGGLIIQTAVDEFIVAGTGIVLTFSGSHEKGRVGILHIEEGSFEGEKWVPRRVMNGDQSHQGRHLRFPTDEFGLQKVTLYRYK